MAWQTTHGRNDLPWQGTRDPYRVWLSEIMLQQTTVAAVKPYFEAFTARWPTVQALAAADTGEIMAAWAGLGYYSRARSLIACARHVAGEFGGVFPPDEAVLIKLPGIGPYTAAAISSIAFGRRAVVVDGNVERVISRFFLISEPLPASKPLIRAAADSLTPHQRPGDFAQAMMDLGATICTPRKPACILCPLSENCAARIAGIAADLPKKLAKTAKPERRGAAFVLRDGAGRLLVRIRPDKGLLGGMTEVPGTEWIATATLPDQPAGAPCVAEWTDCGAISHVFTHFRLELAVFSATVAAATAAPSGMFWLEAGEIAGAALPNVMRKVVARAEG